MTETTTDETLAALYVIGARIREARAAAELTQDDLAEVLKVTQTAVSYWETARRALGVTDLLRIADALEIPAAALLPDEHQDLFVSAPGGQWLHIAFMGHVELTGYVTEVALGGEPGYHIDLPDKIWGGSPLAWEEYSAKAQEMPTPSGWKGRTRELPLPSRVRRAAGHP